MKVTELEFEGLKLIDLDVFRDSRGFFVERYQEENFLKLGFASRFVQDNHSLSYPKVLRGLHIQHDPPQSKLVGVTRGRIFDVVVDLRSQSKTFKKWMGVELSAERGQLLFVPSGLAHGFCVLGNDSADVTYKVDAVYNAKGETGLLWDDPEISIKWPIQDPIVSDRDKKLLSLSQILEIL